MEILDRSGFRAYRSPSRKAVWPLRQLRLTLSCSAGSIERCRASCLLLSLCPPDLARPVPVDRRLIACCQGVIVASRSTSRERPGSCAPPSSSATEEYLLGPPSPRPGGFFLPQPSPSPWSCRT